VVILPSSAGTDSKEGHSLFELTVERNLALLNTKGIIPEKREKKVRERNLSQQPITTTGGENVKKKKEASPIQSRVRSDHQKRKAKALVLNHHVESKKKAYDFLRKHRAAKEKADCGAGSEKGGNNRRWPAQKKRLFLCRRREGDEKIRQPADFANGGKARGGGKIPQKRESVSGKPKTGGKEGGRSSMIFLTLKKKGIEQLRIFPRDKA